MSYPNFDIVVDTLASINNKTKGGDERFVGHLPVSIPDISREETNRPPPTPPIGDKTVAAASIISINQSYAKLQHQSTCGHTP